VIICIGSAQEIKPDDRKAERNTLAAPERMARIEKFVRDQAFGKPYRIISVADIDSDALWPDYLAGIIGVERDKPQQRYTIYFGEPISEAYRTGLERAGIEVSILGRKKFRHRAPDQKEYEVESASDLRKLYRKIGSYEQL